MRKPQPGVKPGWGFAFSAADCTVRLVPIGEYALPGRKRGTSEGCIWPIPECIKKRLICSEIILFFLPVGGELA